MSGEGDDERRAMVAEWRRRRGVTAEEADHERGEFFDRLAARKQTDRYRRLSLTAHAAQLREARGNARLGLLAEIAEAAFYGQTAEEDRRIGKEIADAIRNLARADVDAAAHQVHRESQIATLYLMRRTAGANATKAYRTLAAYFGYADWTSIRDTLKEIPLSTYAALFPELDEGELRALLPPLKTARR